MLGTPSDPTYSNGDLMVTMVESLIKKHLLQSEGKSLCQCWKQWKVGRLTTQLPCRGAEMHHHQLPSSRLYRLQLHGIGFFIQPQKGKPKRTPPHFCNTAAKQTQIHHLSFVMIISQRLYIMYHSCTFGFWRSLINPAITSFDSNSSVPFLNKHIDHIYYQRN